VNVTFSSRQSGEVNILDVAGTITLGQGSNTVRDALGDLISRNHKKILLNLAQVSYIDSSGIRELLSALTALKNVDGQLKLLNPSHRVKDLLQITKLHTVFQVYEDEAAAVASFS
jgi:anti-sigma B factor antagonist